MAKMTLLAITQSILNDMDADNVNSIADTIESTQVAQIVKDTFYEIIGSRTWPHLDEMIQLSPHGTARPSHMTSGSTWSSIEWIKYNVRKSTDTRDIFETILFMTPEEFLAHTNARVSSNSDVDTITDGSGAKLFILNDVRPYYWTTFDDENIVFDAYDSGVDTNLTQAKTQCWGNVEPSWTHTDVATPDLPAKAFAYLLAESKSTCFNSLRQVGNAKEEQKSRRQRIRLSQEKWRSGQGMQFPDYGRN